MTAATFKTGLAAALLTLAMGIGASVAFASPNAGP